MTRTVHENAIAAVTEAAKTSGRMRVRILEAGLGSSGYYSPAVVEKAATDRLVDAGTQMFLDHPSESDRTNRPERSVRDIAAVFTGPATYNRAAKALEGEIQVLRPFVELLADLAPHVGLSIHGSATDITSGVVEGRTVPIVEGLAAIDSVDVVTKAGAGGKVLQLMESGERSTIKPVTEAEPAPNIYGRSEPRSTNPWGRPLAEARSTDAWGRPLGGADREETLTHAEAARRERLEREADERAGRAPSPYRRHDPNRLRAKDRAPGA